MKLKMLCGFVCWLMVLPVSIGILWGTMVFLFQHGPWSGFILGAIFGLGIVAFLVSLIGLILLGDVLTESWRG